MTNRKKIDPDGMTTRYLIEWGHPAGNWYVDPRTWTHGSWASAQSQKREFEEKDKERPRRVQHRHGWRYRVALFKRV